MLPAPVERYAFTTEEAAEALGTSRSFIYTLIQRGEVRTVKIGRCRRVPASELRRLAEGGADD